LTAATPTGWRNAWQVNLQSGETMTEALSAPMCIEPHPGEGWVFFMLEERIRASAQESVNPSTA